jgi:hypothetical protein
MASASIVQHVLGKGDCSDFEVMDLLFRKGHVFEPGRKAKSVVFAEGGLARRDDVGRIVREEKSNLQSLTPRSVRSCDPKNLCGLV